MKLWRSGTRVRVCYNILLFNHVPSIQQIYNNEPSCGQHELHYYLFCYMYCVVYTSGVGLGKALASRAAKDFYDFHRTERSYSRSFEKKKKPNDILSIIPVTFFRDQWTSRIIFVTKLFFQIWLGLNKIQFPINPRK